MKIEVLTDFRHGARQYTAGDRITVPDADGGLFCGNGWARDLSGQSETGTPSTDPVTLEVHSSAHDQSADNA